MWRKKLVLAFVAAVLSFGIVTAVLWTTGWIDTSAIARLQARLFGPDPIGIWQSDSVLGWSHRPGSSGRHRHPTDFDVGYNIDSNGNRRVPKAGAGPEIIFLGGSFTFGYGVEDAEAYPAVLQRGFPEWKAVNSGAMAWGTVHAWLKLTQRLKQPGRPAMIVYGFIDHHRQRNWLRRRWLESLRRKNSFENPRVQIVGDRVVWQGLANPEVHGLDDSEAVVEAENEITARLLSEMALNCRREGVPFLVIYLPDGSDATHHHPLQSTFDLLAKEGAFIDLRSVIEHPQARFPNNNHPSAEGHCMIAKELEEPIRLRLLAKK